MSEAIEMRAPELPTHGRVVVRYGKDAPNGLIEIDGRGVPFCTGVEVDLKAGEMPKVVITLVVPELVVDVDADIETSVEPSAS